MEFEEYVLNQLSHIRGVNTRPQPDDIKTEIITLISQVEALSLKKPRTWLINTYDQLLRIPGFTHYPPFNYHFSDAAIRQYIKFILTEIKTVIDTPPPRLIVGDTHIYEMSGPVSYTILKPRPFQLPTGDNFIMPIIMGFGDLHGGLKSQCHDCPRPGCVNVYDESFLQPLNEVGFNYNINIFVELHSPMTQLRSSDISQHITRSSSELYGIHEHAYGDVISLMIKYAYPCFYHEYTGRKFYDRGCPAKNLKWHFSDVRHLINIDIMTPSKRWFESIMFITCSGIYNDTIDELTTFLRRFCEVNHINHLDLLQDFEDILISWCDRQWDVLPNVMFGRYNTTSAISHQLRRSLFQPLWEREWVPLMYELTQTDHDEAMLHQLKTTLGKIFQVLRGEPAKYVIYPEYRDILMSLTGPLVDIYTLVRLMKYPHDVSVLYLGAQHIEWIRLFLLKTGLCDIVSSYDTPQWTQRCIYFVDNIDLNYLIEQRRALVV